MTVTYTRRKPPTVIHRISPWRELAHAAVQMLLMSYASEDISVELTEEDANVVVREDGQLTLLRIDVCISPEAAQRHGGML